ncbi:MAG: hypothetical protein AAGA41_05870 [Pseudomonadota bacterium]
MFESRTIDHLHTLTRQFEGLSEQGVDADTALQRIDDAVPESYADDVGRLRALLGGDLSSGLPSVGASPYARLATLLRESPVNGSARVGLLRDFSHYVTQTRIVVDTYWAGFSGFILYTTALVFVAFVVSGIFASMVIPSFRGLFQATGGQLPTFSAALLGGEAVLPGLVIGTGLVVAAVIVASGVVIRSRLQKLAPMPAWITLLPGLGTLRRSWQRDLYLNTLRLMQRAGIDHTAAKSAAAAHTDFDPSTAPLDPAIEALDIAESLGLLSRELETQCTDHVTRLTDDLLAARNRIAIATKVILYAIIALLVIAMYQPLFSMGSVI